MGIFFHIYMIYMLGWRYYFE